MTAISTLSFEEARNAALTIQREALLASIAYDNGLIVGVFEEGSIGNLATHYEILDQRTSLLADLNATYNGVQATTNFASGIAAFSTNEIATGRTKLVFDGTDLSTTPEAFKDVAAGIRVGTLELPDLGAQSILIAGLPTPVYLSISAALPSDSLAQLDLLAQQVSAGVAFVEAEIARQQAAEPLKTREQILAEVDLIGHSLGGTVASLVYAAYEGELGSATAYSAPIPDSVANQDGLTKIYRIGDGIAEIGGNPFNTIALEGTGNSFFGIPIDTLANHNIVGLSKVLADQVRRVDAFIEANTPPPETGYAAQSCGARRALPLISRFSGNPCPERNANRLVFAGENTELAKQQGGHHHPFEIREEEVAVRGALRHQPDNLTKNVRHGGRRFGDRLRPAGAGSGCGTLLRFRVGCLVGLTTHLTSFCLLSAFAGREARMEIQSAYGWV